MSSDRIYYFSGARGLSIPGDYNSRFLVMINGHPMTEIIYNSNNFFDQDFSLDMDLVERVEVIRGPTAALFGSNGIFANINVITRSPVDSPRFRASTEFASFGQKKVHVSSAYHLGRGANLLVAASAFHDTGRNLYYPDYDDPATNNGIAERVDGQQGYHGFLNLVWGRWNAIAVVGDRPKRTPVQGAGTLFNSQESVWVDSRNFVGVSYTREIGLNSKLRWHTNYDAYRYRDRVDYLMEDGSDQILDNRTHNWGDWLNSQLIYSFGAGRLGTTTAGLHGSVDLRNLQVNENINPEPVENLRISQRDRNVALFVQQDIPLSQRWTAYLGLRYDQSRNFGGFVSPRLALIYQPSARSAYKLVYGRPFRNPSAYERFYDDGLYLASNPSLTQERAHGFEASAERRLRRGLAGVVNAYHYRLSDVIEGVWISETLMQYQNLGHRRSTGVEFELRSTAWKRLEAAGSFAMQKAVGADSADRLPNTPGRIGKFRAATPLAHNKLTLAGGLEYLSSRMTNGGNMVRPVWLLDTTLSTLRLTRHFDLVAGMRNALNWQYDDPVDLSVDQIRRNGRTFYVKFIFSVDE